MKSSSNKGISDFPAYLLENAKLFLNQPLSYLYNNGKINPSAASLITTTVAVTSAIATGAIAIAPVMAIVTFMGSFVASFGANKLIAKFKTSNLPVPNEVPAAQDAAAVTPAVAAAAAELKAAAVTPAVAAAAAELKAAAEVEQTVNKVKDTVANGAKDAVASEVKEVKQSVTPVVDKAVNTVASVANGAVNTAASVANGAKDAVASKVEEVKQDEEKAAEVKAAVFSALKTTKDAVDSKVEEVKQTATSAVDEVKQAAAVASSALKTTKDAVVSEVKEVKQAEGKVAAVVEQTVTSAVDEVKDTVASVVDKVEQAAATPAAHSFLQRFKDNIKNIYFSLIEDTKNTGAYALEETVIAPAKYIFEKSKNAATYITAEAAAVAEVRAASVEQTAASVVDKTEVVEELGEEDIDNSKELEEDFEENQSVWPALGLGLLALSGAGLASNGAAFRGNETVNNNSFGLPLTTNAFGGNETVNNNSFGLPLTTSAILTNSSGVNYKNPLIKILSEEETDKVFGFEDMCFENTCSLEEDITNTTTTEKIRESLKKAKLAKKDHKPKKLSSKPKEKPSSKSKEESKSGNLFFPGANTKPSDNGNVEKTDWRITVGHNGWTSLATSSGTSPRDQKVIRAGLGI